MSETIGLDIGSHSIKLVRLQMTSKGPFLTHVGIKEIPYGSEKEDPAFVSEAVKALFREVGLKPGKVNLTVSGTGIHIRRITVPSMPKDELKEAVPWEIKGHLPFPVESAQIDFLILGESAEKDLKKLDLITVACPKNLIDRSLAIAEGAGLKPVHLGLGPLALWNLLLTSDHFDKERVVGLIDLGAEKTGIYLFQDGALQFSREVTPGGNDITRAMMEGIDSEEAPDLIYEQAERIKKTMGIPSKTFYQKNGDPSINSSKIPFLVRPVLERLIAEMGRSLDYYKNQFRVERIDQVLLTGGGANLKNIDAYLADELRLPVERFNPLRRIPFDANRIDSPLLDQMGSLFTIALGIALPESKRIELLPAKEPLLSKARVERYLPRWTLVITLFIFAWIVWSMNGQFSAIKKERDEKIAKMKAFEALQGRLTLLKQKENEIKQDLSIFPASAVVPVPFQEILRSTSRIVPNNVTVQLLSVQDKGRASKGKGESPTEEGSELQITGLAFGSDLACLTALAGVIEGLEKSPLFKNARLVSADENKLYNQPGVGFEIICDINLDHPASPPSVPSRTDFSKGGLGGLSKEKQ